MTTSPKPSSTTFRRSAPTMAHSRRQRVTIQPKPQSHNRGKKPMTNPDADWATIEWFMPHTTAEQPPRRKARAAPGKRSLPDATKRAIDDINQRFRSDLNDDI